MSDEMAIMERSGWEGGCGLVMVIDVCRIDSARVSRRNEHGTLIKKHT